MFVAINRMDNTIDILSLSLDDIKEEYVLLNTRYQELCAVSETDAQRIHELKRHLNTALAAEQYLTQELEQATNSNADKEIAQSRAGLEEWQRKHATLLDKYETVQQLSDQTALENERLTEALAALKTQQLAKKGDEEREMADQAAKERTERLRLLEEENLELLQKLNELYEENLRLQLSNNDKENTMEMLKDSVQCLEENLRSKRHELEEKAQLLDSAQEQLVEANAKIAVLETAPESAERKGNSLFAEVDDQRQVMKQLLAAQKRSYMEMKKVYQDSQYEIRRLKNENIAMHKELEACSTLFCSSNKAYQDKLLERLAHATNEKELLERQLQLMHARLLELMNNKGVGWLDSMLNFCKQETDDLKKQLHSARLQQASVEEQLRNVSQELACWRFEALKSRCVLIDRENLLKSNNIVFKSKQSVEFRLNEDDLKTMRPRILSVRTSTDEKQNTENAIKNKEEQLIEKEENIQLENVQKITTATSVPVEHLLKETTNTISEKTDVHVEEENKENSNVLNQLSSPARSSLRSMTHDLLVKNSTKSVTFSDASPLVHQLSLREEQQEHLSTTKNVEQTSRQIQTKSGLVIVRNIVFKPAMQ